MSTPRRDQLAECNTAKEAVNSFQEVWCKRCVNPECTRSTFGQSLFDRRVNSWEDRLFRNPSRMSESDPRFKGIAGQKFLSLDLNAPVEVRGWSDPMASDTVVEKPTIIEKPTVVEKLAVVEKPAVVAASEVKQVETQILAASEPPKELRVDPVSVRSVAAPEILSMNTLSQGGRMLSGVISPQPVPRDPWAAPEPAENVVPVGGRVKFKGSGV